MTFLNPFVLLGMVAAAIPLVIHLFNFRRPRRVDFSSLTFVRELQKTTMQRVRLKQWLLLLLRTLAIAMLVLSFARPTLTGGLATVFGGSSRTSVALVLDNSASMELRGTQGAYLDQARTIARALTDQMEPGDEFLLTTTAGDDKSIRRYRTRGAAAEAISNIELGVNAVAARAAINRAAEAVSDAENVNREIYFVSDLQQRTLGDSLQLEVPSDVTLTLVPIDTRTHINVSIEQVRVESRIVEVGSPVQVEVVVRNYGDAAISDYTVSAFLGDERVAQAPVELPAGRAATVPLSVTPQEQGWLGGRVEGEDDAFPRDNVRFFALHVPAQRGVLLVRGEGADTRYIRLALDARGVEDGSIYDVEEVSASAFPNMLSRIGSFDAVVLVGASIGSSGEISGLGQYVANGGGLFITPGGRGDATDLTPLLQAVGGGQVTGTIGVPGGGQAVARFERVDAEHPIFAGVFDRASTPDGEVESPLVRAALQYRARSGNEQSLIQLTSGDTFLQEIRHGRGASILLAVAPEPSWSDLPVRGLFVPLIYRTLQYLSASEAVQGEDLTVGRDAELRLAGLSGSEPIRIVSPFGEESIPEQRAVAGAVLLDLQGEQRVPGIYDIREGESLVRRIAANVASEESDLETVAAGTLIRSFGDETDAKVGVLEVEGGDVVTLGDTIRARRSGVELWNVFLLLALCFLVAEMFVARRWRPEAVAS